VVTEWQPIETAPIGEEIIVLINVGTVPIIRSAWYRVPEEHPDFTEEDRGWWSYRSSVTQEMLIDSEQPVAWIPMPELPKGKGFGF
jgi:hypothetical protein